MTTIAIMQPYFAPYAGYLRLMEEADIFVIYDCVQFPRRGWVHRNKLTSVQQNPTWLTLPLQKQPRNTLIKDLKFSDQAQQSWTERLQSFQHINKNSSIWNEFSTLTGTPCDFISALLHFTCATLDINTTWKRSSALQLPSTLKNQDRILEIVRHFGGTRYINASGGVHLYDYETFENRNVQLQFLDQYNGPYTSIFERLLNENPIDIKREIVNNCHYQSVE
ncbi:MAG: hypothetical protein CL916_07640 [Deltaproteobacteria bacterium]|nr:hypothetical protein [Deltaproteobacteria bacterium]